MKLKKTLALLLAALLLCAAFPVLSGAHERMHYLVLGDSIGVGSGIRNSNDACFGRIVANTNGYDYKNDAQDGNRTAELIAKLQGDPVAADVAWADIISISIGGNNFLRGNMTAVIAEATAGNYARIDAIVADYANDLETIITRIRALNDHAYILLQTLYNPAPGGATTQVYQEAVDRLNAAMRACAAAHPYRFTIVDVEAAFGADNSLISWDNIHPNVQGNIVIARTVLASLVELGLGTETEPVIVTPGQDWGPTGIASVFRKIAQFFQRLLDMIRNLFRA